MAAQVAVGVVAHSSRAVAAKQLARSVGARFVSIDTNGVLGCDANHEAVQRHLCALGAVWSVVVEDDAVPVAGFREQLSAVLSVAPTRVTSLYLGRCRPPQFQHRIADAVGRAGAVGAHWIVGRRLFHAVGYAIRTELLPSLLAFESGRPVDEHIGAWAANVVGERVGYCWPSLVDHSDVPSVTVHADGRPRLPGRVAWRVGSRRVWSGRSVDLSA